MQATRQNLKKSPVTSNKNPFKSNISQENKLSESIDSLQEKSLVDDLDQIKQ